MVRFIYLFWLLILGLGGNLRVYCLVLEKFVLNLELQDVEDKRRALKTVTVLSGPAKEPEKKEEPKKEESKKEEPKKEETKEESKKEEGKKEETKKEEGKKEEEKKPDPEPMVGMVMPYRPYYPSMQTYYHPHHSMDENPNACIIC
ncbi:Hypothetical predicted protein [Olea europaea subsp. europaea]|uniref:Uncharacterized protein n=1 Tax=Olea europaea subsp. europaea TaxID=158383 RepID=A0A8S0P9I5_OLEEU|nr:Hypothetical predicted protein [Olea europaea subsp. europaea]